MKVVRLASYSASVAVEVDHLASSVVAAVPAEVQVEIVVAAEV